MTFGLPTSVSVGSKLTASRYNADVVANETAMTQWSTYTPALTASTTNPTLGSGSSAVGYYLLAGQVLDLQVSIAFGTSGVSAGSGTYYISIPSGISLPVNGDLPLAGAGWAYDSSASFRQRFDVTTVSSTLLQMVTVPSAAGATAIFTNAVPWTWAASDKINFSVRLRTA